ncbi:hypothetical protein H920_07271 [Fukomys damarensis]|uniref:Uncharacterized protein n=1 Tax=Fukomys damarensis TaxID=885580 RepID=A0A091E868_FUKDA|nr:hypothetical protein H920_07271 [Fukomys damarensis]
MYFAESQGGDLELPTLPFPLQIHRLCRACETLAWREADQKVKVAAPETAAEKTRRQAEPAKAGTIVCFCLVELAKGLCPGGSGRAFPPSPREKDPVQGLTRPVLGSCPGRSVGRAVPDPGLALGPSPCSLTPLGLLGTAAHPAAPGCTAGRSLDQRFRLHPRQGAYLAEPQKALECDKTNGVSQTNKSPSDAKADWPLFLMP